MGCRQKMWPQRLGRLVTALVVLCGTADALNLSFSSTPAFSAAPSRKAEDLLGKAEKLASDVEGIVKANQRLLSAVGGTVLLLHGQAFSTSILFLQSFRSAGLPIMQRGWEKLTANYEEARAVYEKELPNIIKTKALLPKLSSEAQETMQVLRDAQKEYKEVDQTIRSAQKTLERAQKVLENIQKKAAEQPNAADIQAELQTLKKDKEDAEKTFAKVNAQLASALALRDRAQQQYEDARKMYGEAMSSVGSIRSIAEAVNPENVQEILQGMAGGVLSCVAAAKVPVAGTAVVGADFGTLVTEKMRPVLRTVVDRTRDALVPAAAADMPASVSKWIDSSLASACTAAGFFVTLKARELVLTASASAIGAKMLTKSISETLHGVSGHEIYDMYLTLPCVPGLTGKFGASKTSSSPTTSCSISAGELLENVLVVGSLATQFLKRGQPLPVPVQAFLGPFLAFEAWLKFASAGTAVGKVKVGV